MAKPDKYFRAPDEPRTTGLARLRSDSGTLLLSDVSEAPAPFSWDARVERWRAPASDYRRIVAHLCRADGVVDLAREYDELAADLPAGFEPFDHQREALEAWVGAGRRGVVELPTGSGKTWLALMAIADVARNTLVVVPTLDLVAQWRNTLTQNLGLAHEVGMLGGGQHQVEPITVSTYDSAAIHMDRLGGRFGLVIFDEVHHLPSDVYRIAAESSIAPFRLGLTATLERSDGRHKAIESLVGPTSYARTIKELAGDILSEYATKTLEIEMTPEDATSYEENRGVYLDFIRSNGIRMGGRYGWRDFLAATNRSEEGRRAFKCYREQRHIALGHTRKLDRLETILATHRDDRTIVFANDNATVFEISRRFLCPTITHQTPVKERAEVLERFNSGEYRVVATSKVLNEGVDVPEANVAVILSGTATVREHVQRLGRILRRGDDKFATLYELVTPGSVETRVSDQRRDHDAYR